MARKARLVLSWVFCGDGGGERIKAREEEEEGLGEVR
jgi:hypothetical protein